MRPCAMRSVSSPRPPMRPSAVILSAIRAADSVTEDDRTRGLREVPSRRSSAGTAPASCRTASAQTQVQYWASLPIERYMQSAFSTSWSTASRLRLVSRSMTSSGG